MKKIDTAKLDLARICNQAALKVGVEPVRALIRAFTPTDKVPHIANIPARRRAEFIRAVEARMDAPPPVETLKEKITSILRSEIGVFHGGLDGIEDAADKLVALFGREKSS